MLDKQILTGTPAASLLPAARYTFAEVSGLSEVDIPIRGSLPDGADFDIMPEPGVILLGALNQALLSLGKYPKLKSDELFVLAGLEISGENSMLVVGRVYQFIQEQENAENATAAEEGRYERE